VRLWGFSLLLLVVGALVALLAAGNIDAPYGLRDPLPWWILAIAFALTERYAVDLDVRRQAQTLTFTEAPLILGLVLADPGELIVVRVVVSVAVIGLFRRSAVVKLVFNAGLFAAQTAVALFVYHLVLGGSSPIEPRGWLAGVVAAITAFLCSALAVSLVMSLAGARLAWRSQLLVIAVGICAAVAGATAALAAVAVLWTQGGYGWVPLVLLGAALGFFGLSYVRIRERHQALAALNTYTASLVTAGSGPGLPDEVAHGIRELLHAARAVLLLPGDASVFRVEAVDGHETVVSRHEIDPVDLAMAVKLAAAEATVLDDGRCAGVEVRDDNYLVAALPLPQGPGLVILDGRMSEARRFDAEDLQLLETAAGHAATAIHNGQLVNELREEATFRARQALHDDITDLPNSRGLAEALERPLSVGGRLAVLTIRIDSLREVNETLGRAMGDVLLRQVAGRLEPLGRRDWCAKTASDEFTVVVAGGRDEADAMAARVVETFEAPVQCDDVALALTAGIGVALAPDHGREVEILLRRASLAASRSRVEGTRVTTWAADRDPYDPQRLAIAADLRDAIPAGELQVHFQPQVDISSGLVTGAEALVRWRHPRLGELRPDQFIAAAEYTGAIDALTDHVLTVAARTCAGWREQGWDLDVAVNLSARNLANVTFADDVRRILHESGLDAAALTLELTESSIMTEAERAMTTLEAIHGLGVSLSIDDFGTGYSSLAHLRKLPVGEIKIDKSFVFDLLTNHNDEAIVRSMVELGHNLGMTVVVEGVETVEVRRRLVELGADRIQGYLLSRPMPVRAFEQWIADRPVRMAGMSTGEAEPNPARVDDFER